ncbi:MAG: STAS domain-containing protein [Desulfovibrio sp.]|nr:STAS domain-containing protein [Desulfovibrio sp.]
MNITLNNPGSPVPEFTVDGAIDTLEAPKFQETVLAGIAAVQAKDVVIECTAMPYLTSTGLRAFMTIGKTMKAAGGRMVPCGLSGLALEIYTSSGFAQVFPPAETLDDARRMLGG